MAEYYCEYACVIGFVWNESSMFGLMYGLEMLDGGIVAWELDAWDKGDGWYERHEIGMSSGGTWRKYVGVPN